MWFPIVLLANNIVPVFIPADALKGGGDFGTSLGNAVKQTVILYAVGGGIIAGSFSALAVSKGIFQASDPTRVNAE